MFVHLKTERNMSFGICDLSVVPVRSEPSDRAEQVTQLLFGELITLLEVRKGWVRILMEYDGYEGWIDEKQYLPLSEGTFQKLKEFEPNVTLDLVQVLLNNTTGKMFPVVMGSSLPNWVKNVFFIDNQKFTYEGHATDGKLERDRDKIIEHALMYLNAPYQWGGRSPLGIDCSGLTQMVYKICGYRLKRDAHQQATQGNTLGFITEALPGDLAFFDNEEEKIIHVGILLGGNRILHASGRVRIDAIDHQGIFNLDTRRYTHHLRLIKSLL